MITAASAGCGGSTRARDRRGAGATMRPTLRISPAHRRERGCCDSEALQNPVTSFSTPAGDRSRPEVALDALGGLVQLAAVGTGGQVLPAAVADHQHDLGRLARA